MPLEKGFAPAKVNLALHVTGRRKDGYHELDSLVAFAGVGDQIAALPGHDLSLVVGGPFAEGVPANGDNLILRAAERLRAMRGVTQGAQLRLTKSLPAAAGVGGGTSDAAAALTLLAEMWGVEPLAPDAPEAMELGADLPVCLSAPRAIRMGGAGEALEAAPALPSAGIVLVNPKVPVPTAEVFARLASRDNPGLEPMPGTWDFEGFAAWLSRQRNDLAEPATGIAPEVGRVLDRLKRMPQVKASGMSGSGATCWGLVKDMGAARQVARVIQIAEMNWWVAPAPLLN